MIFYKWNFYGISFKIINNNLLMESIRTNIDVVEFLLLESSLKFDINEKNVLIEKSFNNIQNKFVFLNEIWLFFII